MHDYLYLRAVCIRLRFGIAGKSELQETSWNYDLLLSDGKGRQSRSLKRRVVQHANKRQFRIAYRS